MSGFPPNSTLREGDDLELTCTSLDGSPKPQMRWFRGDEEVTSPALTSFTTNPHSMATLKIRVSREDNSRKYRYEQDTFIRFYENEGVEASFCVGARPATRPTQRARPPARFSSTSSSHQTRPGSNWTVLEAPSGTSTGTAQRLSSKPRSSRTTPSASSSPARSSGSCALLVRE